MTILGLSGEGIMCRPAGSRKRQDVASTMEGWFWAGVKIWNDYIGASGGGGDDYCGRVVSVETLMWAWIFDYRPMLATHHLRPMLATHHLR